MIGAEQGRVWAEKLGRCVAVMGVELLVKEAEPGGNQLVPSLVRQALVDVPFRVRWNLILPGENAAKFANI